MTVSPTEMSPHQLVNALVALADAGELPDALASELNAALVRRSMKRLKTSWDVAAAQIAEAWKAATAKPETSATATIAESDRVTPLRKEP